MGHPLDMKSLHQLPSAEGSDYGDGEEHGVDASARSRSFFPERALVRIMMLTLSNQN